MSSIERADMEERFQGHKCWMDFNAEGLLDRRGLEGFLTEKDFWELYKDVGFQERDGYHMQRLKLKHSKF